MAKFVPLLTYLDIDPLTGKAEIVMCVLVVPDGYDQRSSAFDADPGEEHGSDYVETEAADMGRAFAV